MANEWGMLKAMDTVCGQEGICKFTVKNRDGSSKIYDGFFVRNIDASIDMSSEDFYALGRRGAQHKPTGWSGSGSMTIYYTTSIFTELAIKYVKEGIPLYFDILIQNDDPASSIGTQTVILKDCLMGNVNLAKLDVDTTILDSTVDFVFDGIELVDSFEEPDTYNFINR